MDIGHLRRISTKYDEMWDAHLGEYDNTTHRINLESEARPDSQFLYRARPKAGEFGAKWVKQTRVANIVETATSKLATPVVIVPKHEGSFRRCLNYYKRNAVTIHDTYALPRMDK